MKKNSKFFSNIFIATLISFGFSLLITGAVQASTDVSIVRANTVTTLGDTMTNPLTSSFALQTSLTAEKTSAKQEQLSAALFIDNNIKSSSHYLSTEKERLSFTALSEYKISDIFPDSALAKAIANELDKDGDINAFVTIDELESIVSLVINDLKIEDLTGLEYLKNMTNLVAGGNKITDLDPLKYLTNLQSLYLNKNYQINDINSLANLTNLQILYLNYNKINDISSLATLTNLQILYLNYNEINDISSLANLTNLQGLYLNNNYQINDINSLANLTNLQRLTLHSNKINDISSLANLTNLTILRLSNNKINDISPLANLTTLQELLLSSNQISDISPLATLTNLQDLHLQENQISDLSPLKKFKGTLIATGQKIVLPDGYKGVPTEFKLYNRDGNVPDFTISQAGNALNLETDVSVANSQLTWFVTGNNILKWNDGNFFSGEVVQTILPQNPEA